MKIIFKNIFFSVLLLCVDNMAFSQAKQDKYGEEYFEGGYANPKPPSPQEQRDQRENLFIILKLDNKDLMTGNSCVREETAKMGFEYIVVCNRKVNFWNRIWVGWYNFGSNTALTFRNGFGWKIRLKSKVRECKRNSGDFVW